MADVIKIKPSVVAASIEILGIVLIGFGLWRFSEPAALVFLGLVVIVVANGMVR